ncbi:hypothetical protein CBS101457_004715 [Exobasidium rhododendri]|nr:hypothetical protein CBS101457_004715 [Exobasidium rhododendri]
MFGRRWLSADAAELPSRSPTIEHYDNKNPVHDGSLRERAKERDRTIKPPSSPFLIDRHSRRHSYLRISLTERCNLRCMYCMPEEGVPLTPKESLLTASELERVARLFVKEGVNKIRLTGGEPTIRKDLPDVIAGLSSLRTLGLQQIGITTNGLTLSRHLPNLVSSGLTHLNISLDTLDPFKFELMTRRSSKGLEKVLNGVDTALALGVPHVKINVVVIRGLNDGQDVLDFVEWAKDRKVIVRFIEYMPFDGNRWKPEKLVPFQQLLGKIKEKYGYLEKLEDDANDTSKHWRVPGHLGSIGFISSMTEHFCGTCNRLRITADGNLKVCLFGNAEVSLRDAMRKGLPECGSVPASDSQLLEIIGAAVGRKHAKHAGMSDPTELAQGKNRAMIQIGVTRYSVKRRQALLVSKRGSVSGRLLCHTSLPTTPTTTLRLYTSRSGLSDDNPWASLDEAADEGTEAEEPRPSSTSNDVHQHQSWSTYMGTEEDGDESPWASLDAIADGAKHLARPLSPSSHPKPELVQATELSPKERERLKWAKEASIAAASYASTIDSSIRDIGSGRPQSLPDAVPRLTHIDARDNRASMVDVSSKSVTTRSAQAEARVYIPDSVLQLLRGEQVKEVEESSVKRKGPVLQTAQLAGIMGAKRTSELIPLCHGLNLSHVDVRLEVVSGGTPDVNEAHESIVRPSADGGFTLEELDDWPGTDDGRGGGEAAHPAYIHITCTTKTNSQTGVEMEALTGASVASLTLWDMLKSVGGKEMRIEGLMVTKKRGGKSGDWQRQSPRYT